MKLLVSILFIMPAALGCHQQTDDVLKQFIPGSYVRTVHNEFSTGQDTLVIRPAGSNNYTIQHLISYERIMDGKKRDREQKVEHWMALYDEKEAVLRESKRGRLLSFQPEKNTLMVGGSTYQKIR